MDAKELQILNDFRNLQQVSMIVLTPERGYILGYHSRDKEVLNLLKQTEDYEKDIINIQTESFDKDRKIDKLKELLKEADRCLCNSCHDLEEVGGCQVCHINDVKNKINEVLK